MTPPAAADDTRIATDALIVGAGPIGLFQVFELGLLEIKAHVVDSLPHAGGQCIELYPDKPIYDIPAVARCTGRELTERLLAQIRPLDATFHLGSEVTSVHRLPDERFEVEISNGTRFAAKTVFIASGVGSFQPRRLKLDGLDRHEETQVFHRLKDPTTLANRRLVIAGGDDSAVDWAIHYAEDGPERAASVTLLHRRDEFKAEPASLARLRALCAESRIQLVIGQATSIVERGGRLTALMVATNDGVTHIVSMDALLVCFGLSPKLGPIANWGLQLERKQLVVDTAKFETSTPRIFAVGDVNTYAGKKKLILSGFHEAALAAFGAAEYVFPDRAIPLQYTTTSPRLHRVLGVEKH